MLAVARQFTGKEQKRTTSARAEGRAQQQTQRQAEQLLVMIVSASISQA